VRISAYSPIGPDAVLDVAFALSGGRVREVKTRSKTRATGAYPSFRMGRMVHWESPGERDAIKLLDVDPAVLHVSEQPCVIVYRLNGSLHKHIPDLMVRRIGGNSLLEVKTACDARSVDIAERTKLLCSELPRLGYTYEVLISEDLGRQPRLRNVEFVLRHGRSELTLHEREDLRRFLGDKPGFVWSEVVNGEAGVLTSRKACRLILEGQLSIDFDRTWNSRDVEVRPAKKDAP